MSLLKQPAEVSAGLLIKGLVYGQPGAGKTTLALSAPNPVLIDADKGMYRVEKRFHVPSLPLDSYRTLLALLESDELNPFDSMIVDTLGKLLDRMSEYLIEENPKNKQGAGQLSMQGWGALKNEFQRFLKLCESKGKNLIFVAHEKEEKDGDTRIVRIDASGSSSKDILKELDFMGYIEMIGDKRMISFSPCEKFYAKNSLKLPKRIELPNTDDHPNDFIQKQIIDRTRARLNEDQAMADKYNAVLNNVKARIATVKTAVEANAILKEIAEAGSVWDSERVLKRELFNRTKEIGVAWNKEKSTFEGAAQEKPAETQAAPAQADPAAAAPAPVAETATPAAEPAAATEQQQPAAA